MTAGTAAAQPASGSGSGGLLAFLDLPVGSALFLDGASVVLRRDDFVGVHSVPPTTAAQPVGDGRAIVHLVTVRAGAAAAGNVPGSADVGRPSASATTVGFLLLWEEEELLGTATPLELVRRFDPLTEEVSSKPVEEAVIVNLRRMTRLGPVDPLRLVSYDQFVAPAQAKAWHSLTHLVSPPLLRRRGIANGSKLVPGAYYGENDADDEGDAGGEQRLGTILSVAAGARIVDGGSVAYPPVPVLNQPARAARHAMHAGTKRFMKELTPAAARTAFFTAAHPANFALEYLLANYYGNLCDALLGDLQLSYVLFLNLHCFSSLTHWRDLVAMLSSVESSGMVDQTELYGSFFPVIAAQIATMDADFFDDVEFSGGNFLVPALERLTATAREAVRESDEAFGALTRGLSTLTKLLHFKFPTHFVGNNGEQDDDGNVVSKTDNRIDMIMDDTADKGDEYSDGDDGPVVVPTDEVDASMARSLELSRRRGKLPIMPDEDLRCIQNRYPLLVAAIDLNTEDILMTCARALDEAVDVSLVREAAAYLQEVEAKRTDCEPA